MEEHIGKVCPFCKTSIKDSDTVKVCPSCGVPHHETCWEENKGCTTFGCSEQYDKPLDTNVTDICSKCGTALGDDQLFCPKCGTPKVKVKKNVCGKCGADLQDGQEFCSKCGQKVRLIVDTNNNKANDKKKKKAIVGGIIAFAIVVVFALVIFPNIFKSADDYLALGNYEKAYHVVKGERKGDILVENLIAFIAKDVPDSLKDPSSFSLRDAWYDRENRKIVLYVNGANSYGANVSNYWYYTYNENSNKYSLYISLSDLDDEKTYSWDEFDEMLEKMIKNAARGTIKDIIGNSSLKLNKDSIKNINNLFEHDLLNEVKLLEENK